MSKVIDLDGPEATQPDSTQSHSSFSNPKKKVQINDTQKSYYDDLDYRETSHVEGKGKSQYDYGALVGTDIDEYRAQQQPILDRWAHVLPRIATGAVTKFGSGVGYTGALLASGFDVNKAVDNGFSKFFENIEESVKEALPVYTPRAIAEGNILQKLGSASFWTNDVADGVAFMLSSYIPAGIIGKAGMGLKAANAFSRTFGTAKAGWLSAPNIAKLANGIDQVTSAAIMTSGEALFEAKDTRDEVRDALAEKLGKSYEELTDEEKVAIDEKAANAAANTFNLNMAALAPSNLLEMSYLFKAAGRTANGASRAGNSMIDLAEEGAKRYIPQTRMGKFLETKAAAGIKGALSSSASEGLYEENVQHSIQKLTKEYGIEGKAMSLLHTAMNELPSEMINNITDKDGLTAIVTGAIIGGPTGGVGGYREHAHKQKAADAAVEAINNAYAGSKSLNLWKRNEDGSLQFDDNGDLVPDEQALQSHANNSLEFKQLSNDIEVFRKAGHETTAQVLENERFGKLAQAHFEAGKGEEFFAKLESMKNATDEELMGMGINPVQYDKQKNRIPTAQIIEGWKEQALQYEELYNNVKTHLVDTTGGGRTNMAYQMGARGISLEKIIKDKKKKQFELASELGDTEGVRLDSMGKPRVGTTNDFEVKYRVEGDLKSIEQSLPPYLHFPAFDTLFADTAYGTAENAEFEKVVNAFVNGNDKLTKEQIEEVLSKRGVKEDIINAVYDRYKTEVIRKNAGFSTADMSFYNPIYAGAKGTQLLTLDKRIHEAELALGDLKYEYGRLVGTRGNEYFNEKLQAALDEVAKEQDALETQITGANKAALDFYNENKDNLIEVEHNGKSYRGKLIPTKNGYAVQFDRTGTGAMVTIPFDHSATPHNIVTGEQVAEEARKTEENIRIDREIREQREAIEEELAAIEEFRNGLQTEIDEAQFELDAAKERVEYLKNLSKEKQTKELFREQKRLKEKIKQISPKINKLIQDRKERIAALNAREEYLQKKLDILPYDLETSMKEEIKELEEDIAGRKKTINLLTRAIAEFQEQLKHLLAQYKEFALTVKEKIKQYEESIAEMEGWLQDEWDAARTLHPKISRDAFNEWVKEYAPYKNLANSIQELKDELANFRNKSNEKRVEFKELRINNQNNIEKATESIRRLERMNKDAQAQIKRNQDALAGKPVAAINSDPHKDEEITPQVKDEKVTLIDFIAKGAKKILSLFYAAGAHTKVALVGNRYENLYDEDGKIVLTDKPDQLRYYNFVNGNWNPEKGDDVYEYKLVLDHPNPEEINNNEAIHFNKVNSNTSERTIWAVVYKNGAPVFTNDKGEVTTPDKGKLVYTTLHNTSYITKTAVAETQKGESAEDASKRVALHEAEYNAFRRAAIDNPGSFVKITKKNPGHLNLLKNKPDGTRMSENVRGRLFPSKDSLNNHKSLFAISKTIQDGKPFVVINGNTYPVPVAGKMYFLSNNNGVPTPVMLVGRKVNKSEATMVVELLKIVTFIDSRDGKGSFKADKSIATRDGKNTYKILPSKNGPGLLGSIVYWGKSKNPATQIYLENTSDGVVIRYGENGVMTINELNSNPKPLIDFLLTKEHQISEHHLASTKGYFAPTKVSSKDGVIEKWNVFKAKDGGYLAYLTEGTETHSDGTIHNRDKVVGTDMQKIGENQFVQANLEYSPQLYNGKKEKINKPATQTKVNQTGQALQGKVPVGTVVETAKGSTYEYLPDGKTQRFKKVEGKQYNPQDVLVFVPNYEFWVNSNNHAWLKNLGVENETQYEQFLLEHVQSKGSGKKVHITDGNGKKVKSNNDTTQDSTFITLTDKDNFVTAIPVSPTPKIGFYTYDTSTRKEGDDTVRERHLGNKVVKVTTPTQEKVNETPTVSENPFGVEGFEQADASDESLINSILGMVSAKEQNESQSEVPSTVADLITTVVQVEQQETSEDNPFADLIGDVLGVVNQNEKNETPPTASEEDAFNSLYREVNTSVDEYEKADIETEIAEVSRMLDVPVKRVKGIIRNKAWGMFSDGLIYLSEEMEAGTAYHEVFHAVSQMYLSKAERDALYNEVRARDGKNYTDLEAEERLAEDFRDFVMSGGKLKFGKKQQNFFQELWNMIKALVSGKPDIDTVFANIYAGAYKNGVRKAKGKGTFYRKVNGTLNGKSYELPVNDFKDMMESLTAMFFSKISEDGFSEDALNAKSTGIYQAIHTGLKSYLSYKTVKTPAQTFMLENWDTIKNLHKSYLQRFDITVKEEEDNTEDDITSRDGHDSNFKPHIEFSSKHGMPKAVKLLIAGLFDKNAKGEVLKNALTFNKPVDFNKTYNILSRELAGLADYDKMISKLRSMSYKYPFAADIIARLDGIKDVHERTDLQTKFFQAFAKSKNEYLTTLTGKNGIRYVNSDSQLMQNRIKDKWRAAFKSSRAEFYDSENGGIRQDKVNELLRMDSRDMLETLGVSFTNSDTWELKAGDKTIADIIATDIKTEFNKAIKNGYPLPADIFDLKSISKRLRQLVEEEAKNNVDIFELQHMNPEGKTVYSITLNNFLSSMINAINNYTNWEEFIAEFPMFNRDINKYAANSTWLAQVETAFNTGNKGFALNLMEGLREDAVGEEGTVTSELTPPDMATQQINALLRTNFSQNAPVFTFLRASDKKLEYGFSGFKIQEIEESDFTYTEPGVEHPNGKYDFSSEEGSIMDIFYGYFKDEVNRIKSRRHGGIGKNIEIYGDRSKNFSVFDDILPDDLKERILKEVDNSIAENREVRYNEFEESVELAVNDYLNEQTLANLKYVLDNKLYDKTTTQKNFGINKEIFEKYGSRIEGVMAAFTVNDLISSIEQVKLFTGDMAFYKDFFKRTSGLIGTGKVSRTDNTINEYINTDSKWNKVANGKFSVITLRDLDKAGLSSVYVQHYAAKVGELMMKDLLKANGLTTPNKKITDEVNAAVASITKQYSEINEADAQGYITLQEYREYKIRMDGWSKKQQDAYERLVAGTGTSEDLASFTATPLKPQYFGPVVNSDMYHQGYLKLSLMPLIPQMTKDSQLENLRKSMERNAQGIAVFESGNKTGASDVENLYNEAGEIEDREYKSAYYDYRFMKDQQDIFVHEENKVIFGTQMRKLIFSNLFENGNDRGTLFNGKTATEVFDEWNRIHDNLIDDSLDKLTRELGFTKQQVVDGDYTIGDYETIKKFAYKEAKQRGMPDNILEVLEGNQKVYFDAIPNKERVEYLMMSIVNNRLIKQKMNGNAYVQGASTGFETSARKFNTLTEQQQGNIDWKEGTNGLQFLYHEDGKVKGAQILLPSYLKGVVDIKNVDERLLRLIGYRIPTQGLNSILHLEVAGFLPESAGNLVIVPSEIVVQAGSDFDIDKLQIFLPNVRVDRDGNSHYIEFSTSDEEALSRYLSWVNRNASKDDKAYINSLASYSGEKSNLRQEYKEEKDNISKNFKEAKEKNKAEYNNTREFIEREVNSVKTNNEYLTAYEEHGRELFKTLPVEIKQKFWDTHTQGTVSMTANQALAEALLAENQNSPYAGTLMQMIQLYDATQDIYNQINDYTEAEIAKARELKDRLYNELREETKGKVSEAKVNLQKLMDKFALEVAEEIANLSGIQSFEDFKKFPIERQNSPEANQNRLMELSYSILENESSFVDQITPNGAGTLKDLAEKVRAKKPKSELNPKSPTRNIEWKKKLDTGEEFWGGKTGVGQVAVHNTHHILAQRANLYMTYDLNGNFHFPHNKIVIDGNAYPSLAGVYDATNTKKITSILGEFLTAFVDIAKDPFIFELNATSYTNNMIFMMTRLGCPIEYTAYFMNQPIIRDYLKAKRVAESTLVESNSELKSTYNNTQIKTQLFAKYNPGFEFKEEHEKDYTTSEIEKFIGMDAETGGVDFNIAQTQMLNDFLYYIEKAKDLQDAVRASSDDTKGAGKTLIETQLMQNLKEKVIKQNSVGNFEKIFENTFVGSFQRAARFPLKAYKELYLTENDDIKEAIDHIIEIISNKRMGQNDMIDTIKKVRSGMVAWIINNYGKVKVSEDYLNKLFKNYSNSDSYAKQLAVILNNPKSNLGILADVFQPVLSEKGINIIRLNTKRVDTWTANLITEGLRELKATNPTLYSKFMTIGLYQDGQETTQNSYREFMPNEDYTKVVNEAIANFLNDSAKDLRYAKAQIFETNSKNKNLVPVKTFGMFSKIPIAEGILTLNSKFGTEVHFPYVMTKIETGFETEEQFWVKIPSLTTVDEATGVVTAKYRKGTPKERFWYTTGKESSTPETHQVSKPTISSGQPVNIWAGSNENTILSNMAKRPFVIEMNEYMSVEEYFQLQKANYLKEDLYKDGNEKELKRVIMHNQAISDKIVAASDKGNAFEVKSLGKQYIGIDTVAWDNAAKGIMKKAIFESFDQNEDALKALLATGNSPLTHNQASDNDRWKKGFPEVLMEVRAEFQQENSVPSSNSESDLISSVLSGIGEEDRMVSDILSFINSLPDNQAEDKIKKC